MKKTFKLCIVVMISIITMITTVACGEKNIKDSSQLWQAAIYKEDTEIGEGTKTVKVEVKAEDKSITFTIHTDDNVLGDVLIANKLIEGDESEYGLYIKKVNGISGDYDVDKAYWAFYKNGEYMNTGADTTEFADGEHYEFVYTKQ